MFQPYKYPSMASKMNNQNINPISIWWVFAFMLHQNTAILKIVFVKKEEFGVLATGSWRGCFVLAPAPLHCPDENRCLLTVLQFS